MQHAARAIDIAAAERDDAAGRAAEDAEELARLTAGAEDQVDDDVRLNRAKLAGVVAKLLPIAQDDWRLGTWNLELRTPAMEQNHLVSGVFERRRDVRPDKPRAADEQQPHIWRAGNNSLLRAWAASTAATSSRRPGRAPSTTNPTRLDRGVGSRRA